MEVHLAIQGVVHGALLNRKFDNTKLLCLTGTKPEEREQLKKLYSVAPCSFELTLEEALELNLVSSYVVNVINVPLTTQENTDYQKAENDFFYNKTLLGDDALSKALIYLKDKSVSKYLKKVGFLFMAAMRSRKSIVQSAVSKLAIAKELVDLYPTYNTITFAETNVFTTKLFKLIGERALLFHSGMKDEQKDLALKSFKDGRTKKNVLCSTRSLSEGFNVENVNMAIILAFTSKGHTLIQRIARTIRYIEGKQAIIFITVVAGTQEEVWLKSALKDVGNVRYFESIESYKLLI